MILSNLVQICDFLSVRLSDILLLYIYNALFFLPCLPEFSASLLHLRKAYLKKMSFISKAECKRVSFFVLVHVLREEILEMKS